MAEFPGGGASASFHPFSGLGKEEEAEQEGRLEESSGLDPLTQGFPNIPGSRFHHQPGTSILDLAESRTQISRDFMRSKTSAPGGTEGRGPCEHPAGPLCVLGCTEAL